METIYPYMIKRKVLIKVRSIKNSFRKELTSTVGNIDVSQRKPSKHEMSMVKVVVEKFGGDIFFLQGKGDIGLKTPDAIWSSLKLEIKKATGKSSIDSQTRKGLQQINGDGIILLDVSNNKKSVREIRNNAIHRVKRYLLSNPVGKVNIIIVKRKKVVDVLEIKKVEA